MEKIKNFKQLKIWQRGIDMVKTVYLLTKRFPREELYGLTSQMRRSSVSIPCNIAEGFKRYHPKEYRQFLHVTLGSMAELETQIIIANELNFLNGEKYMFVLDELNQLSKMITALKNKL